MTDKKRIPRKQNDGLLKDVFEENFADFLRFVIPDADKKYDLSRGFEFLSTDLRSIFPDRERQGGGRIADLLTKVYLKNGTETYFLVNTEIEGGNDPEFAMRMYEYNHRIWVKYHRAPVISIAFYTGGRKQPRPSEFRIDTGVTLTLFRFLTYHIFDHTEDELLAMNNPFAQVALACQSSHLEGKVPDEELGRIRLRIAKALIRHGYDRDRVISLLEFIKNFLYVRDPEINRIFDEEILKFSEGEINMGVIERVKGWAREEGWQKGQQEGWQKGWNEGREEERVKATAEKIAYALSFKKEGFPVSIIAKNLGLSVEQVQGL